MSLGRALTVFISIIIISIFKMVNCECLILPGAFIICYFNAFFFRLDIPALGVSLQVFLKSSNLHKSSGFTFVCKVDGASHINLLVQRVLIIKGHRGRLKISLQDIIA